MNNITISRDAYLAALSSLPTFWRMKTAIRNAKTSKNLFDFYEFVIAEEGLSNAQLFQDLFVDFVFKRATGKTFLDFGACDGLELSNSLMLEKERNWNGILAEPDPKWHDKLSQSGRSARIITDCIYSESGLELPFVSSNNSVLSGLKDFAAVDSDGPLKGNYNSRMLQHEEVMVRTISLNEVFETYFDARDIEYMSIDTEGSEYQILSEFNFSRHRPLIITAEHNYSSNQEKLDTLLSQNGYKRVFRSLTDFDAWYVDRDLALERGFI